MGLSRTRREAGTETAVQANACFSTRKAWLRFVLVLVPTRHVTYVFLKHQSRSKLGVC